MQLKLWLTEAVTKIGIYGGTFDPIHHAHLILAREALEQLKLERVVFVPAAVSPHKLDRAPTAAAVRLEMLQAAVVGEPRFSVDELELQRQAPSFTIDTVEEFRRREPGVQLFYFIGSDNLQKLDTWHRIAALRRLVTFVVLERGRAASSTSYQTITRPIEISATEIRNRVATSRSIRYLVPAAVEAIITGRELYKEPHRSLQKI